MLRTTLLAITFTASSAHAEDHEPIGRDPAGDVDHYVAAGVTTGKDRYELMGFMAEGGTRLFHSPLFARGMAVTGTTNLDTGRGTYQQARGGVESRRCTARGTVCGSLGVDLGVHHATFEPYVDPLRKRDVSGGSEDSFGDGFDSLLVAPRLTFDGGARVRVRGVLELPYHVRQGENVTGVAIALALGVGF